MSAKKLLGRIKKRARRISMVGAAGVALTLLLVAPAAPTLATSIAATGGQPVTLSGVFLEVHGDSRYADQTLYMLQSSGRQYQLKTDHAPNVHSRAKVSVHGKVTGDILDVTGGGSITVTAQAPASGAVTGTQSVLVINVVWAGTSLTATAAQENNFVFGADSRSVASYYRDTSYGQMTWTGTETPTYAITDPASCNLASLANQAEAAATNGGFNTTAYRALMINAPNLYCGSAGYGEIGGKHAWIQDGLWNLDDGYARLVPTHEIGHALGLYHSHGLECGPDTITATCIDNPSANNEEYGNAWDVMGNNWPGDGNDAVTWFSAKQEMLLGWLSGSRVASVTASGTYNLVPLEKAGTTSPQVLVLTTPSRTYYVEYRQPITQDAFLSGYSEATNSVHVNVSAAFGSDTGPFALDFTPNSDLTGGYYDWYDAPLAMGRSFTDPENTFTISPITQNGTTASVEVTLNGSTRYPLTVSKSGTGAGTVTSSPAGIACGATCSASYSSGTSVTLTEAPTSGSTFGGWAGACSGTSSTCTVSMTAPQSATATFTATTGGTRYEEAAVAFDGWTPYSDASGPYRASKVAGNTAQFSFSGTSVSWLTKKGPAQGNAQVLIDGVSKGTFDTYAASYQSAAVPFTGLASKSHKIVIKALGTKNGSASAANVAVDAFTVGATTTQESSVKVLYDKWKGVAKTSASGGSFRSSAIAGNTATFNFSGTGIDWVTATGPGWGKAQVYIDNVDRGTVDLYASALAYQTVKAYGGLSSGSHTITVKVLGSRNASSTANTISVDAFVVH